jgi:hypothetical protein
MAGRRGAPPVPTGALVIDALEADCRWLHAEVVASLAGLDTAVAAVRTAVLQATPRPRRAAPPSPRVDAMGS